MNKKSFFRGFGVGLIIGALVMSVTLGFDTTGKSKSDSGTQTKVSSQTGENDEPGNSGDGKTTVSTTEAATDSEETTTEETTADDATAKDSSDSKDDGSTATDSKGSVTDASTDVNGKNDVYADGTSESGKTGSNASDSNSSGSNSSDNGNGLSDKTDAVHSAEENGYYSKKSTGNSSSGSNTSADNSKTTGSNTTTDSTKTDGTSPGSTGTAKQTSAVKNESGKGGTITFTEGTTAYEICELLEQIGLRDADEYYDWLLRSGYSESLVAGTYTFTGNETNGGIVWILLGHQ